MVNVNKSMVLRIFSLKSGFDQYQNLIVNKGYVVQTTIIARWNVCKCSISLLRYTGSKQKHTLIMMNLIQINDLKWINAAGK